MKLRIRTLDIKREWEAEWGEKEVIGKGMGVLLYCVGARSSI